jgi:hypothetical protein
LARSFIAATVFTALARDVDASVATLALARESGSRHGGASANQSTTWCIDFARVVRSALDAIVAAPDYDESTLTPGTMCGRPRGGVRGVAGVGGP